jgi:hypothetical protein
MDRMTEPGTESLELLALKPFTMNKQAGKRRNSNNCFAIVLLKNDGAVTNIDIYPVV